MPIYLDNFDVIDADNNVTNVKILDSATNALATQNQNNINKLINDVLYTNVNSVDDDTDITTAIRTIFNSGKNVYIPDGDYTISDTIVIPNGKGIVGHNSNVTFTGSGKCFEMGNDTFIEGFTINDTTQSGTECLILIPNKRNVTIKNMTLKDAYYIAIGIYLSTNVNIVNNTIDTTVIHSGIARWRNADTYPETEGVNIIGNTIKNIGLDGISIGGMCNIIDNNIDNVGVHNSAAGIYCSLLRNSVIKGNVVHTGTGNGIDIAGNDGQNQNNVVMQNIVSAVSGVGILLYDAVRTSVVKNTIYNTGFGGSVNGGACVSLLLNVFNTTVAENYLNTNPNAAFFLSSTSDNNRIDDNNIEGGTISTIYASDGSTSYLTYDKTSHALS